MSKHEQQPAADPTPASPEDTTEATEPAAADETAASTGADQASDAAAAASVDEPVAAAKIAELDELVAERTHDLQRLQAEYANYKKRVDRDRALSRQGGIEAVVLDLLPVLDSIEAAREHDELTGGFKLVAEELERLTAKYGLTVYGEVGEPFDPNVHEALMHLPMEGVEVTTVSAIMQKGVRLNDRVLRPARVGVAEPE
ncbi:nucleotide exchange factor GrpE [Micropruina sp.]|uniref:nucleotide exchange factor GrpE n=1 Tax=Micropruina sp. TaxID=2737536 RepID=UPI0039E6CBE8